MKFNYLEKTISKRHPVKKNVRTNLTAQLKNVKYSDSFYFFIGSIMNKNLFIVCAIAVIAVGFTYWGQTKEFIQEDNVLSSVCDRNPDACR